MSVTNLRKKQDYIKQLLKIREDIPSAIIAGGCLRDQYHGKPINDIDIYVPCSAKNVYDEKYWIDKFNLLAEDLFNSDYATLLEPDRGGDYTVKNYIEDVWEISKDDLKYNIILVEGVNPKEYVTRFFDIGLCKVWCDGKRIRYSSDFMYDSRYKKLTIVTENISQEEFNYMMANHIKKLKTKYSDHKLVVPKKYTELYNNYNEM